MKLRRRFRDLPLVWKLLVPFLTLMISLGVFGGFLIVRDLSTRAQRAVDNELMRRSLDARSSVRDRELYLLESASFAANLQGASDAIGSGDPSRGARLLASVIALKTDLDLLAFTDPSGVAVAGFVRRVPGGAPAPWATPSLAEPFVMRALADPAGKRSSGLLVVEGRPRLAIAAGLCAAGSSCSAAGAAVAAIALETLAIEARGPDPRRGTGVAMFDQAGRLLAVSGHTPRQAPPDVADDRLVRRSDDGPAGKTETLYSPLVVAGSRAGTIAVSVPAEPAFAAVRRTGVRLAVILLAAMLGIVAFGTRLSRSILAQVRSLLDTNRALGEGALKARSLVLANDELGELARGVNQMADRLEASHEILELRVAQRTEEIQRLLKERTDFFAGITHELRTPLGIIGRQADMLLNPKFPRNGARTTQAASTIKKAASQLGSFVDDILEMAKADAGRIEVRMSTVDLARLLDEMLPTLDGLTAGSDVSLSVRLGRERPLVRADREALRAIVVNLADNAVKYTPAGGSVEISAGIQGDRVVLSVSDTGVGIPAEAATRIFEPFYRVPGTRTQRGQASSGLGLSLAKRLVEAQEGRIWFDSRPGGGSTFHVELASEGIAKRAQKSASRPRRGG